MHILTGDELARLEWALCGVRDPVEPPPAQAGGGTVEAGLQCGPLALSAEDGAPPGDDNRLELRDEEGAPIGWLAIAQRQRRPDGTLCVWGSFAGDLPPAHAPFARYRGLANAIPPPQPGSQRTALFLEIAPSPVTSPSLEYWVPVAGQETICFLFLDEDSPASLRRVHGWIEQSDRQPWSRRRVAVLPKLAALDGPEGRRWREALAEAFHCQAMVRYSNGPLNSAADSNGSVCPATDDDPAARPGGVIFFTGLSGSGKSTLARQLRTRLMIETGRPVTLLDGDQLRRLLSAGLGYSRADRDLNIRRIGFVAAEIARHGGLAICCPIAPFEAVRQEVRARVERHGRFFLVHVATPLEECERRDRKGLYARARAGLLQHFTGLDDPYEIPLQPDCRIDTTGLDSEAAMARLLPPIMERLGIRTRNPPPSPGPAD